MTDKADEGTSAPPAAGALARLLRAELDRMNIDGADRGPTWIARSLVDPLTGQHLYENAESGKVFCRQLLTRPRTDKEGDLKWPTLRALAALFALPVSTVRDAVAQDMAGYDGRQTVGWPHFVHPKAAELGAKGRAFLRQASEYAVRDEGLI
ncbi:hypothetical protein KIH74_25515 [Kineosporia sp. J2-2]|uniref:Uncharacterized protein n=1 Tax=Kineosporia corallincola TaxID=2835133 RepID=A0ABS5TQW5_9ACTN|nr:hypothetical protein [Kineosporia corallincola]MBT0772329.1 hypothetical protein [Kineosporia corallincola]